MRPGRPALGAALLFAVVLAIGAGLARQDQRVREQDERDAAAHAAAGAVFSVQQELGRSLSATYALAAIVRQHGKVDDFEALAAEMLPLYGGLVALQLAPDGVIRQIHPLEGNEAALGHDLLRDPDRRFQAEEAVRTRRLTVAGPFQLRQGGFGLVGRLPVFVPAPGQPGGERLWGLVVALVRVPQLLAASRLGGLRQAGFAWELTRADELLGGPQIIAREGALPRDPVAVPIAVPNGEWRLAVAPAAGWRAGHWALLQYGSALALASLLAALAWVVLRQPELLRREVEARTRELARANALLEADVAERQRAEEALRRSEGRFRALIEKSKDMILVFDAGGRVRFWSPSATESLGWTAGEVAGKRLGELELVHPEDRAAVEEADRALAEGRGGGSTVARYRHRDGSWRIIECTARDLLDDPDVRGVVVNARDVTAQRRLEELYRQAQKLESVGRLAGGLAHDFNNLLTVILACAESLQGDLARGAPAGAEEVGDIREAGERARDLIRQLLAFARRQVIAPALVDLGAAARDCVKLLRRLLGEDVQLAVTAGEGLWPVLCDPGQLEQVLMNLAANARDAMPRGGTLVVEAANVAVDAAAAARDPGLRPGEWVRLTVRDSGVGMSAEVKAHLFEPFFTTKPPGRGTGLGLATIHGIVEQSGGHVLVQSEVGRGASFELYFPRATGALPAAPRPVPAARGGAGTETILVVEDDPLVLEVTAAALRAGGYRVQAARSGAEALELVGRAEQPPRLVVSDVVMPGPDGRSTTDELRRRLPGIKVLFVSGYTQDVISHHGVLDAGVQFLPKPFTASALRERVRALLDA